MRVIAINGKARSGKDTLCLMAQKFLHAHGGGEGWEKRARTFPFADSLKRMVCILLGITMEDLNDPDMKEKARPWLVNLGGDVRERDPDAWVDCASREIDKAALHGVEYCFVTDLRYFNELYKLLRRFGDRVGAVRVSASLETRKGRMGEANFRRYVDSGISKDSSEVQMDVLELPDFKIHSSQREDVTILRGLVPLIDNNGSKEEFEAKVTTWWRAAAETGAEDLHAVTSAAYRLSRKLGPEARLMLSEPMERGE